MVETLYTQWANGNILAAGSKFSSGSGSFVSGLNHAYNAINVLGISGGSAAYVDRTPQLRHSAVLTQLTGGTDQVLGSYKFTAAEFGSRDHLSIRVVFEGDGLREPGFKFRYSGAGVGDVSAGEYRSINGNLSSWDCVIWQSSQFANGSSLVFSIHGGPVAGASTAGLTLGSTGVIAANWLTGSGMLFIMGSMASTGAHTGKWWVYRMKGL